MILEVEKLILELILLFYQQAWYVGFVTLGVLGIWLMLQQFLQKGENRGARPTGSYRY